MACLKGSVVANIVIPTPDYVRFAAHYGFAPDFCHAQDPQSKGVVENLVGYAQRDLAVPLFTEAKIAGTTVDLSAANAARKTGAPRSTPASTARSAPSRTNNSTPNANCWHRCPRSDSRSGYRRSPAQSIGSPASGSPPPDTRCRPRSSEPRSSCGRSTGSW